jgi:decaprenyl-phosphate phosphoribosyltransferase
MISAIIQLIRPKHWIKNGVVLLPLLSAMKFNEIDAVLKISIAFIAFCFASSAIYIFNDIHDRKSDRFFKHTRNRPLASGRISVPFAIVMAFFLTVIAIVTASFVSFHALLIIFAFFLLQLSYTWYFKQKVLIDVICIAMGFVLRAAAGAVAIRVILSPWLFICMFTACLFMGFCKRYMERVNLEITDDPTPNHRPILEVYQKELLVHLISVSAGIAILSFLMYSISPSTVVQFGTYYIIYTLPIQVYCVFRFALLSLQGTYASPVDVFFKDRPLQIVSCIFLVVICVILIWGPVLKQYIHETYIQS